MPRSKTDLSSNNKGSRSRSIQSFIKRAENRFGTGIVQDGHTVADVEVVSTGSLTLDIVTGIGGFPRGRIIEIYGPESSGKTTVTLQAAAAMTQRSENVYFVDAEQALDIQWARRIGIDPNYFFLTQPDTGEQAFELIEEALKADDISMIVVDSVSALVPRAEIEGEMGASHVGLQARLMSQAMRKLANLIKISNTTLVFINQIREKIGVVYGNPETTSGGRALKFYATIRIDVRGRKGDTGKVRGEDTVLNQDVRIKTIKNKVAPPRKEGTATLEFVNGAGFNRVKEVINYADVTGHIVRKGSWYTNTLTGENAQGASALAEKMAEHPEQLFDIEQKIREWYGIPLLEEMPDYTSQPVRETILYFTEGEEGERTYFNSDEEEVSLGDYHKDFLKLRPLFMKDEIEDTDEEGNEQDGEEGLEAVDEEADE